MRRQITTVSSAASSNPIPMDTAAGQFSVAIGCVVSAGATLTYTVQHTFDDIFDTSITPTWFDHADLFGETTSQDGNYAFPVAAIRLTVSAYTSGSVTMTLLQASGR